MWYCSTIMQCKHFSYLTGFEEETSTRSMIAAQNHGTCFAVTPDGLILTSNHVVDGAKSIVVHFDVDENLNASVEAFSSAADIALLRVEADTPNYLLLARPRSTAVGAKVFTYGFPAVNILGFEAKFTDGSISALSGPNGEASYLQMSVPIQPGSSGGPVVNEAGEVVGIVAATAAFESFYRTVGTLPQNINFAVKADYARMMYEVPRNSIEDATREEIIKQTRKSLCQVEANM